jgi:uncharacterized protein (DUF4415 family)
MPRLPKSAPKSRNPRRKIPERDFSGGRRGAVLPHQYKTRITIWLDTDILDWFRNRAEREGRGYQTAINDALKSFTSENHRPLPEIVREVIRKELRAALKSTA